MGLLATPVGTTDLILTVVSAVLNTVQAVALAYIAAKYSRSRE